MRTSVSFPPFFSDRKRPGIFFSLSSSHRLESGGERHPFFFLVPPPFPPKPRAVLLFPPSTFRRKRESSFLLFLRLSFSPFYVPGYDGGRPRSLFSPSCSRKKNDASALSRPPFSLRFSIFPCAVEFIMDILLSSPPFLVSFSVRGGFSSFPDLNRRATPPPPYGAE